MTVMATLQERHKSQIHGVLSCYDRVLIMGTIPGICYAEGMTRHMKIQGVRIFDYPRWAEPYRDELRTNAEALEKAHGLKIQHLRQKHIRKEEVVRKILEERGEHPGLVHIISAMESCETYEPWHDKNTHRTFLRPDKGQCLHYYFYFIHPDLGLCHLRVPTWAPFRLQFYFNGHSALAAKLRRKEIGFAMRDNAFVRLDDFEKAQKLADELEPARLHRLLDECVRIYCPVIRHFPQSYHWSLMQAEYATDILFRSREALDPIYNDLVRTTIHAVKPDHVATFLGRKLNGHYEDELGNDFHTRIEGTCIKHHMGPVGIKMYNKHGLILRIETVTNDVSFFKHHRLVEHRDGKSEKKLAPMRKTIYSLPILAEMMAASNRRYLDFLSAIDDPTNALRDLDRVCRPVKENERSYRGFNLFHGDDQSIFETIARQEFFISGFRNRQLQSFFPHKSPAQISHVLKRLHHHGLIRKIGCTYKYYLSKLGKRIVALGLKLKEMSIVPLLRGALVAP
jgi:hypothetical protein